MKLEETLKHRNKMKQIQLTQENKYDLRLKAKRTKKKKKAWKETNHIIIKIKV